MQINAKVPLTESATSAATRPLDAASAFHLNRHAPPASGWRRLAARLLPLASAVCACGLPLAASAQCTPAPTNIVAWWPAEGHSYEIIRLREAALLNGAGYAPGKVGQAFSFDGPNERVQIIRSELRSTNRWTIEAWVKPANFTNSSYPTIYSEGARVLSLGLNNGTGKLESWINAADGARLISTVPVTNGVWNHVALTRNGNTRTLYVNGVAAGTTNSTPTTTAGSGSAIGHDTQDGSSTAFAGAVDELSLYHRALSAAEILAIYNAGSAGKCYSASNPEFVIQPVYQTNYLGATASFTALAMGSPAPSYQWLFNGSPLAGKTDYTLTLTNLTFAHAGPYSLRATSGSSVTNSTVAQLAVRFCTDTAAGLVAWWPGDGSGLDVTSNHNGAVWGGVTYPPGKVTNGPAFGFNGSDAYVAVPNSPALSPHVGTNGEMTVEAWVYIPQLPSGWHIPIGKGDSGRWEYDLEISSAGVPGFYVYSPSASTYIGASGGQMIPNQWHHLVGVLKKGEFIRLYQDGMLVNESTNAIVDSANSDTPLYLGRRSDGYFFNGRLDEIALYNRALTSNEIATLYAGGAFGKCAGASSPAPFFAVQPASANGYYFLSAGLQALALGTPRPDYQWYRSNSPTAWGAVTNATNASLSFAGLDDSVVGFYRVTASNVYGGATSQPAWLDVIVHPIVNPTNIYGEDFELGWNGWTADNYSIWQAGVPHSVPGGAHHSNSVVATVLDGNYPDNATSWLVSPSFEVPSADQKPRLRFWAWYSFSCDDYVQLYIRTNGGAWQNLATYSGHSGGTWFRPAFDLLGYAGSVVQLGFYFYSHDNYSCNYPNLDVDVGLYVDEVKVVTGLMETLEANVPESFEDGLGDWYVTSGTWEIGPGAGRVGPNGAATRLAGNYYDNTSSWLVSPPFAVPPTNDNPRLRFCHTYGFSCDDYGTVYIREVGGSWQGLASYSGNSSWVWSRPAFDLAAYAGKSVELGFYFYSHDNYSCSYPNWDVDDGWYVDEVMIATGPPHVDMPEGFEHGLQDWYVSSGTWEVGYPTSGPGGTHSGTSVAATVLGGNYYDNTSSYLISPSFVVPPAGENPRLRFWHWFSFNCDDLGRVRIANSNGWNTLAEYGGGQTVWANADLSLAAFAGQTVSLGFYFYSHDNYSCSYPNWDVSSGWYVDDMFVKRGNLSIAPISDKTVAETNCLTFPVIVIGADGDSILSFSLGAGAPAGAQIDPETGVFHWCPSECQGPGTYTIPIYVVDYGNNEANDLGFVRITVTEVNEVPWLLPGTGTAYVGQTNYFPLCSGDPDCPRNPLAYSLLAPVPAGATIDPGTGFIRWVPTAAQVGSNTFQVELCDGGTPNYCVTNTVKVGVTAYAPYSLEVTALSNGDLGFTIHNGQTNVDYALQQTSSLCECPCQSAWQDVGRVSPTTVPYTFVYPRSVFGNVEHLYFRLNQVPR